jgi:hypothetical protein
LLIYKVTFKIPKVKHLKNNYIHKQWVQEATNASPAFDYFSFAHHVEKPEMETNTQYNNLLSFLTKRNQSKTIIALGMQAQRRFDVSVQLKQ